MIVKRFEELAARYENKIAVKAGRNFVTYGHLNQRANRIAHRMMGVSPGEPATPVGNEQTVALLFDHGVEQVVALLAALKARKIYVPLDSTYPRKRLEYMLEDSGANLILTSRRNLELAKKLAAAGNIKVIDIDVADEETAAANLDLEELPDQMAYILYTSGSTGNPKGVVQSCRNVVFFADNYVKALSITPMDRITFLSSFSHDGAVQDIYSAILTGATLYPLDMKKMAVQDILECLVEEKITLYHSVPTVFRSITGFLSGQENFPSLRLIVTGGEPLLEGDVNKIRGHFPGTLLAHMYGQTESSVNTMGFIDVQEEDKEDVEITIGDPLEGVELLLLKENGEEVEGFEIGEIFVACDFIAHGYWKDPEASARVFLYDEELGRLYRTGDLGRYHYSGRVEFIGRKDRQVKIRGFRVDLREIENLLQTYKGIKEAVVIARAAAEINAYGGTVEASSPFEKEDKVLCAYFVPEEEIHLTGLRNHLSRHLPGYMIPSYFVPLEQIPRGATGKVDIKALPAPGLSKVITHFKRLLQEDFFDGKLEVVGTEIDVWPGGESERLLLDFNEKKPGRGKSLDCARERVLHKLFEEQAAKTPDHTAVVSGDRKLTYFELNKRANRLARFLRTRGVKPGHIVGLIADRSMEMIAAILGILKAGGAYLALEAGTPQEQLIAKLDEAGARILLANTNTLSEYSFTVLQGLTVIKSEPQVTLPRPQIEDFDSLPFPDRSFVDYEKYSRYIGHALVKNCISLQATRGCPYSCAYCHKIWPKSHVCRSAENIFEEVRLYYNMGVKRFAFIDDVFNLNIKNSMRFFELIIKNKFDVQFFFPNGMRGDILTKEYIDLMVNAGTTGAALALETASPRLQKVIGKNLKLEKLRENIEYICKKYPQVILELFTMHGFPGETEEEALLTLDFIKSIKWLHFPYINILRIYANTRMAELAISNGISSEAISRSASLAFHELPETLPFDKDFTFKYQADFLNDYFLLKERLLHVLGHQVKVLSEDEMVQKYNSYLEVDITTLDDFLKVVGITRDELGIGQFLDEDYLSVSRLNTKLQTYFPAQKSSQDALRLLLLDLSQLFSSESDDMLYDLSEPPLGLMYVLTYLKRQFGDRIFGKIAKSRTDFDSYEMLKQLLVEFRPDVIGIRTLTMHKNFFHKTITIMRQWGIEVPIFTGGPYATTDFTSILQDANVDIVVLGEGEITAGELIEKILANDGKLPDDRELQEIKGIVFTPGKREIGSKFCREIIMLDQLTFPLKTKMFKESGENLENINRIDDWASMGFDYGTNGIYRNKKVMLTHRDVNNLVFGLTQAVYKKHGPDFDLDLAASCVFDAAPQQIFGALQRGCSLYVVPAYPGVSGINVLEIYRQPQSTIPGLEHIHIRMLSGQFGVRLESEGGYTAPRDEKEERLAAICAELLKVDKRAISIAANLIELGLHSLRSIILISRIHKEFNVKIPLTEIFRTPTIKGISGCIKKASADRFISIEPVEKKDYYPLSPAQKRIYILQQMAPASTAYNMSQVVLSDGELEEEKLAAAFRQLIKRHRSLRTSFKLVEGQPVQQVHDRVEFEIEHLDAGDTAYGPWGEDLGDAGLSLPGRVEEIINHFVRPFNLSGSPLLRVGLIRLGETRHILIVDMHHIVSDVVSHLILVKDFILLYQGKKLDALRLHYNDYSEWLNREEVKKMIKRQEQYWLGEYTGKAAVLDLPGDYSRPPYQVFEGRTIDFAVKEEETRALNKLALAEGTTLYVVLLSVFNILLARLSGQQDIVVGTAAAGRRHLDLERIIGMFVNTLALRNYPEKENKFVEFLRSVKESTLKAFENQDYPFEDLVDQVSVSRDTSRNPLFDVLFVLQDGDIPAAEIPGLKLEPYEYEEKKSKFDLTLRARKQADHLLLTFEYCTKLFKRETIEKFIIFFKNIVFAVSGNPRQQIAHIEIIPESERQKILFEFNDTEVEYPGNKTIHELFEEQAVKRPDNVALVGNMHLPEQRVPGMPGAWDEVEGSRFIVSLTYRELNEESGRLAVLLRRSAVKPGRIAAVMIERSIEMMVGIMGILKAGGAYLPIEPHYPPQRVCFILGDCSAKILLTRHSLSRDVEYMRSGEVETLFLEEIKKFRILEIEKDCHRKLLRSSQPLNSSQNPAYVIYTSGSTGKPKGVMIEHRSVVNRLNWMQRFYPLGGTDVILQKTPYVFDVSVWELFWWSFSGAALCLLGPGEEKSPAAITAAIKKHRVTTMHFVPSMLGIFLEYLDDFTDFDLSKLVSLRQVFSSGEALSSLQVKKFNELLNRKNSTKLINLYGPTEATVDVSYYDCPGEDKFEERIPIGKPIDNIRLYIVDKYCKLQPIGIAGELCISGDGLAKGYVNRPELTAEKFIENPYSHPPSLNAACSVSTHQLIYHTGDLARWLPDGNIEFLSRLDYQVKIRGNRVELGEVESRLLEHEGIKEAVVIDREEGDGQGHSGEKFLCAYIKANNSLSDKELNASALRDYLSSILPDYMIPSYFVLVDEIPLTTNGKVDRKVLQCSGKQLGTGVEYAAPNTNLEKTIAAAWQEVLNADKVGVNDNFFALGGNSLKAIQLNSKLNEALDREIPITAIFEHVTIRLFVQYLTRQESPAVREEENRAGKQSLALREAPIGQAAGTGIEIAIIGMSGRFPGARDIDELWRNLKNGVESISFVSDDELREAGVSPVLLKNPKYVRSKGGILEDKESFDSSFFDYTPREAEIMDPQIRVFHECAWEALENAGYDPTSYDGAIGIYAGASSSSYWESFTFLSGRSEKIGDYAAYQLANKDYLCTRIAYKFNLKGPAVAVQTTCSTSLVAVHLACRAAAYGECDLALAGGVSISTRGNGGYVYQDGMISSPDGHCRVFDVRAKGIAAGSGCGIVVLKELKKAVKDGDYIHAVIKGTAVNNDGIIKAGYTAPSREGQTAVIRAAHRLSGVDPGTISYIEAHGTGTTLGDPIEIEALKQAFASEKRGFCGIGSVKANVGHLDAAAGITGLIKTVLALKHKLIPPTLHYEIPNPKIDFENSPFYVNSELRPWKFSAGPLRAGVSSFGIGGTNAHAVLEEWRPPHSVQQLPNSSPPGLILLSARTPSALEKMTENLVNVLKEELDDPGKPVNPVNPARNSGSDLANVVYTLQVGRKAFPYRKMVVCSSVEEAVELLSGPSTGKVKTFFARQENLPVVFLFPGQGSQYVNMGLDLYKTEPLFREEIDRCFDILEPLLGRDLKEILYPSFVSGRSDSSYMSDINQTEFAQPIIFIIEYALAKLLMSWGIKPYAMVGHSIGEYAAACLSGVFSLEQALNLVVFRAQLMQEMPPGAMLGVPISEEDLSPLLASNPGLSLAAVNGPSRCVVSGSFEAMERFEKQVNEKGYQTRHLQTSHAFHSQMMDPILEKFSGRVREMKLNQPGIPYLSNVTGNWITFEEAVDSWYWAAHLRHTVRFAQGLNVLLKEENSIFLELGPGKVLSTFVRQHTDKKPSQFIVDLIRHSRENTADHYYLLNKIGDLWLYGQTIHWWGFYRRENRRRVPLPTYPFERQSYQVEEDVSQVEAGLLTVRRQPRKKADIEDFFYVPLWKQSILAPPEEEQQSAKDTWLVFKDSCGLAARIVNRLEKGNHQVVTVEIGTGSGQLVELREKEYTLNPHCEKDFEHLLDRLRRINRLPEAIVHFWGVTGEDEPRSVDEQFEKEQELGFYSLLYLVKAIRKQMLNQKVRIILITDNMQAVTGEEALCPGKLTALGLVKVIPQEIGYVKCRSIDIALPRSGTRQEEELVDQLLEEITAWCPDTVIAYRNNHRWVQYFDAVKLGEHLEGKGKLKEGGVYLIIGGLGKIGLSLAEYLAATVRARLVLTGRSALPLKAEWDEWLAAHDARDETSRKILKIREIEALGGEVMVLRADVFHQEQMQVVLSHAQERFGTINGVIHAAGETRSKSISCALEQLDGADCREQFLAKAYGVRVLESVLAGKELDFCLLISSLSSVLGGLGFAAYAAANLYMDAFVQRHNQVHPQRWTTVNWDAWRFEEIPDYSTPGDEAAEMTALTPAEGQKAFQRILSWGKKDQVIVSTWDLQTRLDRWIKLENLDEESESGSKEASPLQSRPDLTTPYAAPRTQLEQELAGIWQRFFGFEKIGIHDDFFELGGDSLKAIGVVSRIHKEMNVEVPLTEFFNKPFIAGVAGYVSTGVKEEYLSIRAAEEREFYALSSAQKRLYVLQQLAKSNITYNLFQVMVIEGEINRDKLERALKGMIARHESLRTSIKMTADEPVQRILRPAAIEFSLRYYEADEVEKVELVKNFVKPFDLSKAPFLRVGLIKEGEARHILLIDTHHIVTDAVSRNIFIEELMTVYRGEELLPLRLQYKDYSQWQNIKKENEGFKKQEKYWLDQFKGEIPLLILPSDYVRPVMQSFAGSQVDFEIGEEETKALEELAEKENVTLYMVLLAVYNVFLSKVSGCEEVVVGSPTAGRRNPDLESIIGIFINTLALKNRPVGHLTFIEFLQEVREGALKAFENQDYQFEDLVEKLDVKRDTSRNPLFDVMLVLQSMEFNKVEIPGLTLKPYEYENQISKFDLTLFTFEIGEKLWFTFEYCTKLFREETIEKFTRYFKTIMHSVIEYPRQKLSAIEILGEEEKSIILYDFNDTKADYPGDKTIPGLFEEQVGRTPDSIALLGQRAGDARHRAQPLEHGAPSDALPGITPGCAALFDVAVTYKELSRKSAQLALLLKKQGVTCKTIVAVMVDRSIDMMVIILGILKAGGVYLPIDPDYPQERVRFMLIDSLAKMLITNNGLYGTFETNQANRNSNDQNNTTASPVLNFGNMNFGFVSGFEFRASNLHSVYPGVETKQRPLTAAPAAALAYVIYTSGSTGKPKGVAVDQPSVVNRLNWMQRFYPLREGDVILQKTPVVFDVSVWELFWWFFNGASLCLLRHGEEKNPAAIIAAVERNHVTTMHFVPSMLNAFLEYLEDRVDFDCNKLATLRRVFSSGEALGQHQVTRFYRMLNPENGTKLINLYGPTEATVDVSYYDCPREDQREERIPIGKPIDNIRLYIVDKYFKLQPIGIAGELCISGDGLAKGYLNRPELTSEKFVENPYSHPPSLSVASNYSTHQLIYHTGDLARWLPDGNIEFLGRIDHQVKIRGNRIELGEIETQLLNHGNIKEAVVLAKGKNGGSVSAGDNGDPYLCAYFTVTDSLTVSQLREYLSGRLPGYMIPSYFAELEDIPLTPNGKLDRKALESYDLKSGAGVEYAAPESEMEKAIAHIWKQVLGIDKVGIHDNFFDIGGNSLSIIKVNSILTRKFEKDIAVTEMFRYPTIGSLVEYFSREEGKGLHPGADERINESVEILDEATNVLFADEID